MSDNDKFDYTYSAPTETERREIESIKRQYAAPPKSLNKLDELRKLNKRVTLPPMIAAIATGITGTLVFGVGMTMVLEWDITVPGVIVGILGAAIAVLAYPLHHAILKRNKRKYGKQIIALSDELLNKENQSKD